jgi:hypothetical protein
VQKGMSALPPKADMCDAKRLASKPRQTGQHQTR